MNYQEALYHMDRLADWQDNEVESTWGKFLALIGEGNGPEPFSHSLGFLEAGLLGKALQAYSSRPDAFKEHFRNYHDNATN